MTPTEACIALNMLPTRGPVRLRRLLEVFASPDRILGARRECDRAKQRPPGACAAEPVPSWEACSARYRLRWGSSIKVFDRATLCTPLKTGGATESRPDKGGKLKWDLVVVGCRRGCLGRRRRPAGTRRTRAFVIYPTAAAPAGPAANELQAFTHDFEFAPFLAGGLVVPGVELQASLNKDGASFF